MSFFENIEDIGIAHTHVDLILQELCFTNLNNINSQNHVEAAKQKQFAALPLVIVEMSIFYWIFTSLVGTMRTLKLRRNEVRIIKY